MSGSARWVGPALLAAAFAAGIAAPVAGRADDGPRSVAEGRRDWAWAPSILLYVLPGESGYLQPTLVADREGLHLEGRYNYEARETGSAWIGWNFSFGEKVRLGLVPMLGAVFGRMNGVAPGLLLTIDWGPVSLWSQGEYVVSFAGPSTSFFYVWSELGVTGPDWLRIGVVLQRSRAFQTATQVQGGPMAAVSAWKLTAAVYLFAPGHEDQFLVLSLGGTF